jgi:SAM-dependent methyltransferase
MDYERHLENEDFNRTLMRQPKIEWIYYAMKRYASSIKDSSVLVFGSTEPYIEVAALELGAKHVTTIEYNNLTYMHSQITTVSAHRFPELYTCHGAHQNTYDIALSVSSFDHDGLGRYGDPLDPAGDLKAMSRAMGLLRPGGILLLTVPIGPDLVVWNLLRRYGELRLPLLLEGWEVVEKLFWDEAKVTAPEPNFRKSYEPVLVLRKPLEAAAWLCDDDADDNVAPVDAALAVQGANEIGLAGEEL